MVKRKWIALLLAGGRGTRLAQLTTTIVKPAVPFGGKYRIVDFALSNCKNSGLEIVGVLTQYCPLALHAHLGNSKLWNGGLTVLPPYQRKERGIEWYQGTSHAVFQHIEYIDQYEPDDVLILSADQIYKMDYSLMLRQHKETNADCTIAVVQVPWEDASRFGLVKINPFTHIINDFEEKPEKPTSNLASMGIYIFKWSALKEYLIEDERRESSQKDFAKDIIPTMMRNGMDLYGYCYEGYWRDVGTVHSYWEANMDLLNKEKNIFLREPKWEIYTADINEPPLFLEQCAKVSQSLLSEGCEISGNVEHSVLYSRVKVGKGASIKNSVILPGTIIEENAWVENAVIGSHSLIKNGVIIISKNPDKYLMVVGNQKTIDPMIEHANLDNHVITVLS